MLELRDIKFSVKEDDGKQKDIINGISLKIDESKFVAITGPNGSGKSTLAKLIVGIIKPTSGKIIYNGTDITDMSISDRAKLGISFAFQQPVRFKGIKEGIRVCGHSITPRSGNRSGTQRFWAWSRRFIKKRESRNCT